MRQDGDDLRWRAVVQRDRRADGAFVYAVVTTGVYCRPSCPSRVPRRGNVRFFDTAAQARAAGFRPCKRCRPDRPAADGRPAVVAAACRIMEEADETVAVAEVARQVGVSPGWLRRLFVRHVGVSPKRYALQARMNRVRRRLAAGDTVTEAIFAAGFSAAGRFYEQAGELGMAPSAMRKQAAGQTIGYVTTGCRLGRVLVAATPKGICAVYLGDRDEDLVGRLRQAFAAARLVEGGFGLEQRVEQVVARIDAPGTFGRQNPLPLDVQATAFQRRVWEELGRIAAGTTATYGQVAERIGRPGAARAVAQACAANPVAVLIPCHRVVRADGALGGYRWGLERKQALLEAEKKAAGRKEPSDAAGDQMGSDSP